MEKKKETPWTEKKKMFKDGDLDVYRNFNWLTWRNMTEGERAMWTEFSEVQRAPIPKETIEFERKVKAANVPKKREALLAEHLPEEVIEFNKQEANSNGTDAIIISAPITNEQLKEDLKAELKERGIYFHPNSKPETLQKKLADADNPE